jgi:hypothetical protein
MSKMHEAFHLDPKAAIGAKVIEMADRLRPMTLVVPGAKAHWSFEMDGTKYDLIMAIPAKEGA